MLVEALLVSVVLLVNGFIGIIAAIRCGGRFIFILIIAARCGIRFVFILIARCRIWFVLKMSSGEVSLP